MTNYKSPLAVVISDLLKSQSSFLDTFYRSSLPTQLVENETNYPKYNIYRPDDNENAFTVQLCTAGWSKDELKIFTKEDVLYVETEKEESEETEPKISYFHKGIAERKFKWSLSLPKYSVVKNTTYKDGILSIDFEIKLPKDKQPKYYTID